MNAFDATRFVNHTLEQTANRFGIKAMPVFNFIVQQAGTYDLTAFYTGDTKGPTLPVYLFPESVQNVKQTLIVGIGSFALFLGLGIFTLVKLNTWSPKAVKQ